MSWPACEFLTFDPAELRRHQGTCCIELESDEDESDLDEDLDEDESDPDENESDLDEDSDENESVSDENESVTEGDEPKKGLQQFDDDSGESLCCDHGEALLQVVTVWTVFCSEWRWCAAAVCTKENEARTALSKGATHCPTWNRYGVFHTNSCDR